MKKTVQAKRKPRDHNAIFNAAESAVEQLEACETTLDELLEKLEPTDETATITGGMFRVLMQARTCRGNTRDVVRSLTRALYPNSVRPDLVLPRRRR